jgi:hypothetical protein
MMLEVTLKLRLQEMEGIEKMDKETSTISK